MSDNAELVALRGETKRLRARIGTLQAFVDRHGEREVNSIVEGVHDAVTASDAAATYDAQWFAALPFSAHVTRRIALRLIEVLSAYPFIDVSGIRRFTQNGN